MSNDVTKVNPALATEPAVDSPCVYICALDDNDICMGCYRSGEEITHWGRYSNAEKREVMERVGQRERASGNFIAS